MTSVYEHTKDLMGYVQAQGADAYKTPATVPAAALGPDATGGR